MQVVTPINNLKEWQIKNCSFAGSDDTDGTIYQRSESGKEFNIIRWINYNYSLTLQYVSAEVVKDIIESFMAAKNNREQVTISKDVLIKKGYIDFKTVPGEPKFDFELKNIKPSLMVGKKGMYQLSIALTERVDKL